MADVVTSKPVRVSKAKGAASAVAVSKDVVAAKKAPRRPRFNLNNPTDYLNLRNVWVYRTAQRRSLRKMRTKVQNIDDLSARTKMMENISRNERNLEQLAENLRDVSGRVSLFCDLSKSGVSVDPASAHSMTDVVNLLTTSFKAPVHIEKSE
jgi:hypothetical protein